MSMKQSGCRHRECRSSFGVTDARESAEPKASINTLIVVVEPDDIVLPKPPANTTEKMDVKCVSPCSPIKNPGP